MKLSIIVPAYNEQLRISRMLESYLPFLEKKYLTDFEMIIVVNGSKDDTENIVRKYASKYPQVKIIVERGKIGKGAAIKIGFKNAQAPLIGFVDADGSTPPESFQKLIDSIDDADIAIASRWLKGSDVKLNQPFIRRLASRVFNRLVNFLFKLNISDTQCGAKVFTREAVQKAMPNLGITKWAFDVDFLFQITRLGGKIVEVPIVWRNAPGSKIKITRASVQMFLAVVRLRLIYSPFSWIVTCYNHTIGKLFTKKK
jgi:glycosyltransferase involved in cell wall biosynthesis